MGLLQPDLPDALVTEVRDCGLLETAFMCDWLMATGSGTPPGCKMVWDVYPRNAGQCVQLVEKMAYPSCYSNARSKLSAAQTEEAFFNSRTKSAGASVVFRLSSR